MSFGDRLVKISILARKRLDLRHVLDVHFSRKAFGVPRHKITTYKLIFGVVKVWQYQISNFRQFRDGLVWVSILVRKRLDLRHVLEVLFGRNGFGYLHTRERPLNLYSVLS